MNHGTVFPFWPSPEGTCLRAMGLVGRCGRLVCGLWIFRGRGHGIRGTPIRFPHRHGTGLAIHGMVTSTVASCAEHKHLADQLIRSLAKPSRFSSVLEWTMDHQTSVSHRR
jgi:hypothetical protein